MAMPSGEMKKHTTSTIRQSDSWMYEFEIDQFDTFICLIHLTTLALQWNPSQGLYFSKGPQTCGAKPHLVSALLTRKLRLHWAREVSRANPKGLSPARLRSWGNERHPMLQRRNNLISRVFCSSRVSEESSFCSFRSLRILWTPSCAWMTALSPSWQWTRSRFHTLWKAVKGLSRRCSQQMVS